MLSFLPGSQALALAGLAAASAPVIIHLLNRRRFRVVEWAAMDFLLDASRRSRRLLEIRDLLVLVLRTAAVAFFGLAVARPFLATGGGRAAAGPVHAVVVIDNSLSMGRERLGGRTLLDDAREKVADFVGRLPAGSRTAIVPLCGPEGSYSLDAWRTAEDAIEALGAITVVDRRGTAAAAIDLAGRALALAPDLPAKRVVFIGDQQDVVWPADISGLGGEGGADATLPDGMQVAAVAAADTDNTWVDSLQLVDGIADLENPARFVAVVRHEGQGPRAAVQVSLEIDGAAVADDTIDLEPGQAREVTFEHAFDTAPEANRPAFAAARVVLSPDALPGDDSRSLVVPVVAGLPVVFADQFGATGEQPRQSRYGETWHLRRLLAPIVSRVDPSRQLVDVRHVRLGEATRDTLADVRLAVVAGAASPESQVPLLREFVQQGGRLVIAAGAEFDAAAWQDAGWLDGRGVLPVPIGEPVGVLPDEARDLKPFFLDWRSMKDAGLFRLPGVAEEELEDLYGLPVFLKAVTAAAGPAELAALAAADVERAAVERREREAAEAEVARLADLEASGKATPADRAALAEARERLAALVPDWLAWARGVDAAVAAVEHGPRVLAAFDNGVPFLVSRPIGRGRVVWVASGLHSPWNTLPRTNAMLMFDRLLRSLLAETLPTPVIDTAGQFTLPLAAEDRRSTIRLARPDGTTESLTVEALGADAVGVMLRDLTQRGIFTITAARPDLADRERRERTVWTLPLAVNGPAIESQPRLLDAGSFAARLGGRDDIRWVDASSPISIDGSQVQGLGSWWWLALAALACLAAECAVLARTGRDLAPAGGAA